MHQLRQALVFSGMCNQRRVHLPVHMRQPAIPLGKRTIAALEPTGFDAVQFICEVNRRGRQRRTRALTSGRVSAYRTDCGCGSVVSVSVR